MNNALRITLIVFALLLIVLIGGNFFKKENHKKITQYSIKMKEFEDKIAKIDELKDKSKKQQLELIEIQKEMDKYDKQVLPNDAPPISYDYLLKIIKRIKGKFIFDFNYSGSKDDKGLIMNSYLLRGSGKLSQVYKFFNEIERQKAFYVFHGMAINAPEITISDTVNYSFMLSAITKAVNNNPMKHDFKKLPACENVSDLFTCGIMIDKLAQEKAGQEREAGLLDLGSLRLIAVIDQEAYFRDANGLYHVLKTGDKVLKGILSSINSEMGVVTFTIDTGNGNKETKEFNVESGGRK